MSARGAMRARRTGQGSRRPRGSEVSLAARQRRARRRRRAVLLLITSLALLVPIGLQIRRTMADQAVADQAVATQVVADQAAADRAAADQAAQAAATQARADQAAADRARADQATADQAVADQAKSDQAAADQAAADQAAADQAAINKAKAAQPAPGAGALEPHLSQAFSRARTAALAAGLDLQINSGFRSAAEQQRLYDAAIAKYGSPEKARHWVLPPAESDHVKGLAIDVGSPAAAAWLEKHGVRFGLCRRYLNEWWHFELLAPALGQRCPALEPYAGG
jgi:D-alanyl-D-alanine carboxypeptidase